MTSNALTLVLVGEINLQNRSDPAAAFEYVMPKLKSADVLFGHLEGPLTAPSLDPEVPDIPHKNRWRHSHPSMVTGLQAAGFAAMSFASNVTYGRRAVLDTVATLDAANIKHCGGGKNLEEARRPALLEKAGVKFGFLSYTSVFWPVGHAASLDAPGVATIKATTAYQPGPRVLEMPGAPPVIVTTPDPVEFEAMKRDVKNLRDQVDILVVSCHWGVSGSHQVQDYQRAVGQAAITAGADIVIGHHPHVIQGIELWKGRPIFYSMGNFAFDWEAMRGRHLDGLLVTCGITDRRLDSVSLVPVRRNSSNTVELLDPAGVEGRRIAEQVATLSAEMNTKLTLSDTAVEVIAAGALSKLQRASGS